MPKTTKQSDKQRRVLQKFRMQKRRQDDKVREKEATRMRQYRTRTVVERLQYVKTYYTKYAKEKYRFDKKKDWDDMRHETELWDWVCAAKRVGYRSLSLTWAAFTY